MKTKNVEYRNPSDYDIHFDHVNDKKFMKRIEEFINEEILRGYRFLFVNKKGSKVRTTCSYCGHKKDLKKVPKQLTFVECENCKSRLEVRNTKFHSHASGTYADFILFETSSVSKDIIVAYQFSVSRKINGSFDEIKVSDNIINNARYYFEIGGMNRTMIYSRWRNEWDFTRSMYKINSGNWYFRGFVTEQLKSVLEKSNVFKYFPVKLLNRCDGFDLLDLYTNHTNIELLINMGLGSLIEEKVNCKGNTFGTINWNGKTVQKMLKLNRSEIKLFQNTSGKRYLDLYAFQAIKKFGMSIEDEFEATVSLINQIGGIKQKLYKLMKLDKPSKIVNYLNKQKMKAPKTYYSFGVALSDFTDMLDDMEKLSIVATKSNIYPKDLNRHHTNLSAQIKQEFNEAQRQKAIARAQELSKFNITTGNFEIFPPTSVEDLVNESKKLHHCVSSYANKYVEGKTNLFFLREKENIEEPFYTIEVDTHMKLVQCRGKSNKNVTENPEANKALKAFLNKIQRKNRSVTHEQIAN